MAKIIIILALIAVVTSHMGYLRREEEIPVGPKQILDLLEGLVKGSNILDLPPDVQRCLETAENVHQRLVNIYEIAKKIKPDEEIFDELIEIIDETREMYKDFTSGKVNCKLYVKEELDVLHHLIEYFERPEYIKQFLPHLISSSADLKKIVLEIHEAVKSKDFYNVGFGVGKIIKLTFYWDFQ